MRLTGLSVHSKTRVMTLKESLDFHFYVKWNMAGTARTFGFDQRDKNKIFLTEARNNTKSG